MIEELEKLAARSEALEKIAAECAEQMAASHLSLNGFRMLQAVARQEHYPLGRTFQRWLSCLSVGRLKTCPPSEVNKARGSASQAESRTKVTLTVEAAPQAHTGESELPRTAWIIPGVLMR